MIHYLLSLLFKPKPPKPKFSKAVMVNMRKHFGQRDAEREANKDNVISGLKGRITVLNKQLKGKA